MDTRVIDTLWVDYAMTDIDRAWKYAEQEHNIPILLDSIDIVESPDELSNRTYVSREYALNEG